MSRQPTKRGLGRGLGALIPTQDDAGAAPAGPLAADATEWSGSPAPVAGAANLGSSSGFEGMALSADGSKLYPTLENAVTGDDPQTRRMYEFDLRTKSYSSLVRTYRVGTPGDAILSTNSASAFNWGSVS